MRNMHGEDITTTNWLQHHHLITLNFDPFQYRRRFHIVMFANVAIDLTILSYINCAGVLTNHSGSLQHSCETGSHFRHLHEIYIFGNVLISLHISTMIACLDMISWNSNKWPLQMISHLSLDNVMKNVFL